METFGEKVRKDISYTREIPIKFPLDVYKEFSEYSKEEAGNCYWLGIKKLLEEKKNHDRYLQLIDRVEELENTLASLLSSQNNSDEENKMEIKTFGKKEKVK